jgi:hypothetical protein
VGSSEREIVNRSNLGNSRSTPPKSGCLRWRWSADWRERAVSINSRYWSCDVNFNLGHAQQDKPRAQRLAALMPTALTALELSCAQDQGIRVQPLKTISITIFEGGNNRAFPTLKCPIFTPELASPEVHKQMCDRRIYAHARPSPLHSSSPETRISVVPPHGTLHPLKKKRSNPSRKTRLRHDGFNPFAWCLKWKGIAPRIPVDVH